MSASIYSTCRITHLGEGGDDKKINLQHRETDSLTTKKKGG